MADLTLSDGRKLVIDLYQVKRREFVALVDNRISDEEAAVIMGRAIGLPAAEVEALSMMDWRALFLGIVTKGMEPLAEPDTAQAG